MKRKSKTHYRMLQRMATAARANRKAERILKAREDFALRRVEDLEGKLAEAWKQAREQEKKMTGQLTERNQEVQKLEGQLAERDKYFRNLFGEKYRDLVRRLDEAEYRLVKASGVPGPPREFWPEKRDGYGPL